MLLHILREGAIDNVAQLPRKSEEAEMNRQIGRSSGLGLRDCIPREPGGRPLCFAIFDGMDFVSVGVICGRCRT